MNISYGQKNVRDSLIHLLQKSNTTINFSKKDSVTVNLLNQLGLSLRFYKADSLLKVSKQALNLSEKINYKKGGIEALNHIGHYYSDKGNHEKAIQSFETALKIASEEKQINLILYTQRNLGVEYFYTNDYARALEQFLKGIEIATKANNKSMLSIINENIAIMYATQKDYEQALMYFEISRKINEELGSEYNTSITLANIARTHLETNQYEDAMHNIDICISFFKKHKFLDWLAFCYQVKGQIYVKKENYKEAIIWFKQSQTLYNDDLEDERPEADLLNGIAEAYLGLNKNQISEKNALNALEISTRLNYVVAIEKSSKILYKISKSKNDLVSALKYHEINKKISDSIAINGGEKSLLMLKTKINYEQQKQSLIEENEKALAKKEKYIFGAFGILFILSVLFFIMNKNTQVQKKLNKELNSKKLDLEKNERELINSNETKSKLFSIIAHDLRAPIGAFQSILSLHKNSEVNKQEFMTFIPKLHSDINHISFTLNNLLAWGQTQMNKSVTNPSIVSMETVVLENIQFLSEIAENKSIQLVSQIPNDTIVWCDIAHLDIILRNLISNAIKFTPKNGKVTVATKEKNDHWQFYVQDTGVGISVDTQKKIFASNSTVTTYGTENEKGTGLGLTLCKEMIENNNGKMWVESALNEGTCFYFTLPKPIKNTPENKAT